MHVLVTGGSGVIGQFVTEQLTERGHDVTVFDRIQPATEHASFIEGDITDADGVRGAILGHSLADPVDRVVHLAAILPTACQTHPKRAERINIGGTLNVFDAARDAGIRAIYMSSKAVYGPITGVHAHPTYEPLGEDALPAPANVYGATKLACDHFATAYRATGLDAIGVRFAQTYGPGKTTAYETQAWIPSLIEQAATGSDVHVTGADQRNDHLYYGDAARGLTRLVEVKSPSFSMYHFGSGMVVSLRALTDVLRDHTDARFTIDGGLDYRGSHEPYYCQLDISRARSDLGYEPAYPPDRAIPDYLDRYEQP